MVRSGLVRISSFVLNIQTRVGVLGPTTVAIVTTSRRRLIMILELLLSSFVLSDEVLVPCRVVVLWEELG